MSSARNETNPARFRCPSGLLALLALSAMGSVVTGFIAQGVSNRVQELIDMSGEQKLITEWKSAGPLTQRVETTREAGESDEAFAARHKAAVDALKALYPPIQ